MYLFLYLSPLFDRSIEHVSSFLSSYGSRLLFTLSALLIVRSRIHLFLYLSFSIMYLFLYLSRLIDLAFYLAMDLFIFLSSVYLSYLSISLSIIYLSVSIHRSIDNLCMYLASKWCFDLSTYRSIISLQINHLYISGSSINLIYLSIHRSFACLSIDRSSICISQSYDLCIYFSFSQLIDHVSIYLSFLLFIYLPKDLAYYAIYLPVYLSISPQICLLPISPSIVHLFIYLSIDNLSVWISRSCDRSSIYASIQLAIDVSLSLD